MDYEVWKCLHLTENHIIRFGFYTVLCFVDYIMWWFGMSKLV